MKPFLAVAAGFVASFGMFVIGLFVTTTYLTAEPVDRKPLSGEVADLWTAVPKPVDQGSQQLQRIAPPVVEQAEAAGSAPAPVDAMQTSALQPPSGNTPEDSAPWDPKVAELQTAHVEWCADRYRSYDPANDSYRSFSGQVRTCVSPYSEEIPEQTGALSEQPVGQMEEQPARLQYASGTAFEADPDHISYCLSRYRSYSPDDNSYQPYGGGPRRQCQ